MLPVRLDYLWVDVDGNPREKTKILKHAPFDNPTDIEYWTFDGSSTGQSETKNSDLLLKPVKIYNYKKFNEEIFAQHLLVLCEVLNPDGSPHTTNTRNKCMQIMKNAEVYEPLFGIEQEYVITEIKLIDNISRIHPYNWNHSSTPYYEFKEFVGTVPVSQGKFYCGIGTVFGRKIVEEHIQKCLELGISICGTNAEVMASQWEYQIGPVSGTEIGDQLIVSRYLLKKIAEHYNADILFHPKPIYGWNGSGGHTNFSTKQMREGNSEENKNGLDYIYMGCEKLSTKHNEHMKIYGEDNNRRLCGNYETSDPLKFTYGVGDRSCSVRIPQNVYNAKQGYLEDRRPASNLDPYLVCGKIVETICL